MDPIHSLWTFPTIIFAAFLIAWAAECGQFFISRGLALAVLAWVQTLPEFAVEAAIAREAAQDPEKMHLITANFTGSLRLFVGLGWPMVYFVALFFGHKKVYSKKEGFWSIRMHPEDSITALALVPALLYFLVIYFKGTLELYDGLVLGGIYAVYLFVLSKLPPHDEEDQRDLPAVCRWIMKQKKAASIFWILAIFLLGGVILWFVAHPFLESMLGLALVVGMSQFVFVQWVAPFLSEFPEKLSAFNWARRPGRAPMALTNFVSSSVNQWTVLVAMVPFIYSFAVGRPAGITFDEHQRAEILLTIVQSYLGFLFLASMTFSCIEAVGLFALWLLQFLVPSWREEITVFYGVWAVIETARLLLQHRGPNAFSAGLRVFREQILKKAPREN